MKINELLKLDHINFIRTLLIIAVINITAIFVCSAQLHSYKFRYLTVDEGLSHTDANDIAQDKNGYIWIGTYFGLDRFDGYSIRKYYNKNNPLMNAYKNRIRFVYPDQLGKIWIGTEDGLQIFDPKSEKYSDIIEQKSKASPYLGKIVRIGDRIFGLRDGELRSYAIRDADITEIELKAPKKIRFTDMATDQNGLLFLSTNTGIYILDKRLRFSEARTVGSNLKNLSCLYINSEGSLLTSSADTIYLLKSYQSLKKAFVIDKRFSHPEIHHVKNIFQKDQSDYWINIGSGLIRVDKNLKLIQHVNSKVAQSSLNSSSVSKVIIDRSGCLWLATFGGGVNYCDLNEKLFGTMKHDPENPNSLSGNHVRAILADGENLWIGTNANGLNFYSFKKRKFTTYNTINSYPKLKSNMVTALAKDGAGNIWIGSSHGIDILKADKTALLKPKGYEYFPSYIIETLAKDCFGNIWFGNHVNNYGVIYEDAKGTHKVKYYDEGYFILPDSSKPELFISSTKGLKRLIIDNQGNITKQYHYRAANRQNALSSDYTYPIVRENKDKYWVGTMGGGLNAITFTNDRKTYSIKTYNADYGIYNDVESVEMDVFGRIWIGGNGLECLDPKTGKVIRYDKNDGLQGNSFKVGASYKGSDGKLYFGGISGLNYFYPGEIKSNTIDARPILTDILINNNRPDYGPGSHSKIENAIGYGKELSISHDQNNFIIFFSSMHFANPLKCKYRYKLIGFDQDWKYTDGRNPSAAYSNLDFKRYVFMVQATNNDGIWSKSKAETSILIIPPWWKSNLAKLVYLIAFISILLAIYIFQARWYRLKHEIAVRQANESKREEIHKQREEHAEQQLMFFTNISHEFRTPLTLILGPLENLIKENTSPGINTIYQVMFKNTKRLLNLVSELMNFRKASDNAIKLQVQPVTIRDFCVGLAEEFNNLAARKNFDFKVKDYTQKELTTVVGYFDREVLEKILFNLLNNSFKYTADGGTVLLEILTDHDTDRFMFNNRFKQLNQYRAKNYIYFRISDSGIGISRESIEKIFDRYYRVSTHHLGSGVGLALVKSLTQIHKGDIYVSSERHKGTEIIIGIPSGEEDYTEQEKVNAGNISGRKLEPVDSSILIPLALNPISNKRDIKKISNKRILIVEDNDELRSFLKYTLEKKYLVEEASDGNMGLEMATENIPDLIISDVMMPDMNGTELCRIIKDKFETRHVPFIILSAKDALESKIEGMESGADFYFTKPLSIELLSLTIQNIFEQAEKVKEHYSNNYNAQATVLVHSEKDKAFVNRLLSIIEENIRDPELDVDFLCNKLYISRTKLYQKIKSISDQSVADFIRTIRLKTAIRIMTHEDVPLYEVSDRIGLQSSATFSRAFKKEYGKSPLQYMQSLKNS